MTNSLSAGDGGQLRLTAHQLESLFPFHLLFDREMRLVQAGPSVRKACPGLLPGASLPELFELERPRAELRFDYIERHPGTLYLLRRKASALRLRGQMMLLESGSMAFLCSAWLPEPGALREIGLTLDDFPMHDAMLELVQVVQTQRIALGDLQKLTDKLHKQREGLREANRLLQQRSRELQRLGLIAARTNSAVIVTDANWRIEWTNESFTRIYEYTAAEALGKRVGDLLTGPGTDPETVQRIVDSMSAGLSHECELRNRTRSGHEVWVAVEFQPVRDERGTGGSYVAIHSDITAQKELELRTRLGYSVARILNDSRDPGEALPEILKSVCESIGHQYGAFWRLDPGSGDLVCDCSWASPDMAADFTLACRRAQVGREEFPGAVCISGALQVAPSLEDAPPGSRLAAAFESGLRSGFAKPVRASGQVRGVLEFFSAGERPGAALLDALAEVCNSVGQYLESHHADEQREQAFAVLSSTLESIVEGIVVTGEDGKPIRINRRFSEIFALHDGGGNPAELASAAALGCEDEAAWRDFLAPGSAEQRSGILRLRDGRVLEVQSSANRGLGRVCTFRDITEAHRSQREREQLLARLNATLEAATDGILVAGLDEEIVTYNRRFLELWRIPPEMLDPSRTREMRAFAASQLTGPQEFLERIEWLYRNPEAESAEILHFLDGRVYERTTQPFRVGDRIAGRVWSYRDVSERWRADQALRESEERYRVVAETASDVILTFNKANEIVFANEAAGRVFGYAAANLAGWSLLDLIPEWPRHAGLTDAALQGLELTGRRANGTVFPVEVSLGASSANGRRMFTAILRDISQRKAAEEQLQNAIREAEAANRAKTEFLANVSHEIRTPLNAMIGLTELVRETSLDREQSTMLETVWNSSQSLLHLINDLLDVSKIEAGQVDIAAAPFHPGEVLEQAVDVLRGRAAQKDLSLHCWVEPASAPPVSGDINRVRQVLLNLLNNAIKFTGSGGVTAVLGWTRRPASEQVRLEYRISDTGRGIAPEDRERIFDKFVQVGARSAGGAGLGLNISRALAAAMGGDLHVESELGRGSTFRFVLEVPLTAGAVSELPSALARRRVALIHGPSPVIRPEALRCWSLDVVTAATVAELEAIEVGGIPLLIADSPGTWVKGMESGVARILRLRSEQPLIATDAEWPPLAGARCFAVVDAPALPGKLRRAFEAVFGVAPPAPAPVPAAPCAPPRVQPMRLLVAEDNRDNFDLLERVLTNAGYRLDRAHDGEEAVAAAGRFRYDAILMDIQMPTLDGFEATRRIRQQESDRNQPRVPIVAVTAHAVQQYREQAFASEMDEYITKPIRPAQLLEMLRRWVDPRPVILSVDDSPANQEMVRAMLKTESGWRLVTARDGEEAVALAAARRVSLVLLDMDMPGIDGYQTARLLRALPNGDELPIVALTGHAGEAHRRKCLEAGCDEHLEKPIRRQALLETIARYVGPSAAPEAIAPEAQFEPPLTVWVSPDIADLVPNYLRDRRAELEQIKGWIAAREFEPIRRAGHNLKGTGGGYGFPELTELGRKLETAAREDNASGVNDAIAAIEVYLNRVRVEVRE